VPVAGHLLGGAELAAAALQERGIGVVTSRQPRTASVEDRGRQLATVLERVPCSRLVLVGHSMGGLDAAGCEPTRSAAPDQPHRHGRHAHRGTRLAEHALGSPCWRGRLARLVDRGALHDLTPEGAGHLNEAIPDREDVTYLSLAGALTPAELPAYLRPLGDQLAQDEGENDGLVSVRSAVWGTHLTTVDADHLGLIGRRWGHRWTGPGTAAGRAARWPSCAGRCAQLRPSSGRCRRPPRTFPCRPRHAT
jgi:triacylglycerol lipase